ncbi:MAG: DNA-directed RNA polymerase specialized sigma24 family protein [Chlamydiales bacterium]
MALALGGGDEAEHLAHWAVSLAVTKGAKFDPQRGRLGNWLFFLARNVALSQLRKLRPEVPLGVEVAASARTVESRIHNREAFLRVWRRIGSETLRQVLFLDLKHHGQAPGAMARELGMDRGTFYKRRCEARRAFREIWTEEFGDPERSFYGELE